MTYPTTPERFTQGFASATNHNVDLSPFGGLVSGGLVIVLFNCGAQTTTTPSGWTSLGSFNNGGARYCYAFAKIVSVADSRTLVNCVTGAATVASANVYYFADRGYILSTCVAISAGATGTSTTPNPDSLTSGFGAVDTTWIAVKNSGAGVSSNPTNYTNGQTQAGYGLTSSERNVNGASENPGTYTDASSTTWVAFTIAVRLPLVPTLTTVAPEEVYDAQANIVITGTNFEAAQGTGGVELASSSNYAAATKIAQTETAWSATSVTFTVSKSTLDYGTVYAFVTSNAGFRSAGYPITLIESEPALLQASAPAAELEVILYASGGASTVGAIVEILEASITEGINQVDVATFKAPYTAGGVSLATAGREVGIRRAGEGELFRGVIVRVSTPVDEDGITVVSFSCLSLSIELQRRSTWRSVLLLDSAAQDGLDDLLAGSGWTGTVTGGGYQARTKEFVNQSLLTAVGEFADTHQAYWRESAPGDRDIELKNYHSPSGIVLTNLENAAAAGQFGLLASISQYDVDASQVVNRVSFEMKSDSARLITPQESSRTSPYPIQSVVRRTARVVSAAISLATHKVSLPSEMLGENRYAIALFIAGTTVGTNSSVASIGGQGVTNLRITQNGVVVWGGVAPTKGQPSVDFEDEASSITIAGVVGLENVDQFDPLYGVASSNGSSTSPSVSVDSDADCVVVAWLVLRTIGAPIVTPTASQTLIDKIRNPGGFDPDQTSAWQLAGGASTTSFTWTISPSQQWEAFAVALRPAKLHFIEDSASQATYGVSEEMLQLGSFNEVEPNHEAIANAGYDALTYYLRKKAAPPRVYAAEATYLPGTPLDWRPGDTIRFLPRSTAVVADERLIVVERTHSYDAEGVRRWSLTLSDTPQIPVDQLTVLAKLLSDQRAIQTGQV